MYSKNKDEISGKNKQKRMEAIEEADLKSFPANSNISACGRCYFLRLEGDLRFEDVVGPASLNNLARKEFVVRCGYIDMILLQSRDEKIKSIQKASGATIAIISYPEGRLHHQERLELWGTPDQVKSAESLILKAVIEWYGPYATHIPTILMQAPFCRIELYVPVSQLDRNLQFVSSFDKAKDMEAQSGAWIKADLLGVAKERSWINRLIIFGGAAQIYRVLIMVHKAALEPYICVETGEQELTKLEDENMQHNEVYYPSGQVSELLLNTSFDTVKEMETQTGARIQVDQIVVTEGESPDDPKGHRQIIRLKIFGNRAQIYQVLTMVHKVALKPYIPEDQECAKLEDENKQHHDSQHVKEAKDTSQVCVAAEAEHIENDYIVVNPLSDSDWLNSEHVKEAMDTRHVSVAAALAEHNENAYIVEPLSSSDWLKIDRVHQIRSHHHKDTIAEKLGNMNETTIENKKDTKVILNSSISNPTNIRFK